MKSKIGASIMLDCVSLALSTPAVEWSRQERKPYKSTLTKSEQVKRRKKNKMQKQSRKRNRK